MSVQSPGYPGLCCFCNISPAALRLDGLLVVVRPVGYPATLRLDWLLVGGAACGIPGGAAPGLLLVGGAACGFPGGAALGRATGWWCFLWDE
ncbi:hypothetical protein ACU6XP_16305 [Klebsiella aerogenes]